MREKIIQKYIGAHYQLSIMKLHLSLPNLRFVQTNEGVPHKKYFPCRDLANLVLTINLATICRPCVNL